MLGNGAAGLLGVVLQIACFVLVSTYSSRRRGFSLGLVHGGIVAVYGYALVVAFLALLAIPWQAANVLLALTAGLCLILRPVRRVVSEGVAAFCLRSVRAWGSIVIVAGLVLVQVFVTAIEAETSVDGQLYHGPALANMVQSGSLWGWSASNQYVYYTDLNIAGGVNLATFAGDARFDNALQIPHLLLMILLINWALSKRYASSFARLSFAALIVSAPVIWLQPRILYVDLAYGVAVLACILFSALVNDFRRLDLWVSGIAIGAVFATKPTGILTGMLLLLVMIFVVVLRGRKLATTRIIVSRIAVAFGVPLLMATSFYVRNLVQFGNPVYPIQVKFGPLALPGIVDLSVFASGERGNGLVDPGRVVSYFNSIGFGMLHGVTKLDYDPRIGGYGFIPAFLILLAVALIVVQVISRFRGRGTEVKLVSRWKAQFGIVSLAIAILLLQPATFDARYVIGPTTALVIAIFLTSVSTVSVAVQVIAGIVALLIAFGQIAWTERTMYPGIKVATDIIQGPEEWQPNTPGNPRGLGIQTAWLPENSDSCLVIALQTNGGVTPSGMTERSFLGTLSYGLYGAQLCNRVLPITLGDVANASELDPAIYAADYFVLYQQDISRWEKQLPDLAKCLSPVYSINGNTNYPQDEIVFQNSCN